MIIRKSPAEIEAMKEAGRVSAKVLREVGAQVRPGVSTLELDELAEALIRAEGGVPAFKGYGGFPGSICASVNEQIVHGIPSRSVVLKEGDIISIDTGAIVDGWVGDNAWTYAVGKISPEKKRLLDVTERCGACGLGSTPRGRATGWATSATPCRAWPRKRATAWCESTWGTASDAICTRIPTCRTSAASTPA